MDRGDNERAVRSYYAALDGDDYAGLRAVLAPEFVQYRPDRTFEGREEFVEFMRAERPLTDTSHAIDEIYAPLPADRDGLGKTGASGDHRRFETELAVRGRLLDAGGTERFDFLDVHRFEDGRIAELRTYTR